MTTADKYGNKMTADKKYRAEGLWRQSEIDEKSALIIRYSKTEFYYEGQELRPEVKELPTDDKFSANKKPDQFHGHFNTFF
jgi:hypothetical protein